MHGQPPHPVAPLAQVARRHSEHVAPQDSVAWRHEILALHTIRSWKTMNGGEGIAKLSREITEVLWCRVIGVLWNVSAI